jgi:radical SAM protein with 4Fe4S-binding SPASM domain
VITAKNTIKKYLTVGEYNRIVIKLFGGEPFLEFELIKEICEWTWSKKWIKEYLFFIDTNGTLISNEIKEWVIKNRERLLLGLSLDGTKKTHNLNRCNSFDKIDLNFFKENYPNQPVKMTISDRNLSNLAEDVIFIHKLGFKIGSCNFAEGVAMTNFKSNYDIIAKQFQLLIDYYLLNTDVEAVPLLNIPLRYCEISKLRKIKQCGVGESISVVDVDGKIYPCSYLSSLSLTQRQLRDIQQIDFTNTELFIDTECEKNCYLFPICNSCYGDNFISTGKLYKRSFQKCELMKLRIFAATNYKAKLLLRKQQTEITYEDSMTINAIAKINTLFNF